ncbi:MAG: UDP-N-acetylglucosamine--N-acetylmuramyl-(pentapeptide) pyrophosphoryl-undecaprenol N-acetylglucosamine transferase [Candidatus Saganbacteria bacterium]|uniref:UDP-N-acetylglucosamine--N-acetylmuramyl-(pentapeptide) pyrophosphoryl-undecaprenol N-acetylglucosamine transferase n=1 Tax=Candidatus Saganbacteria bacterium TaxID=2575572 RepID=A0A833L115_UNCSA|nr:MAG: UDP-N-acetylglucosamine--N-acetylmuramyl-(pentapeptide) pyrophosphoryl-undecaprenol N-acetylglucosamine transferase [Candidatus Saganbacteria bacterium]
MRIVIAAGGTGGHIYPGIAIAEALKNHEVLFIGSLEGLEKDIIKNEGYKIELIHARALLRKISYQALSAPFIAIAGFFDTVKILKSYKPKAVVVTGGYVSFPVIAAAIFLRIPFVLHEQNVLPGFTNRFWAKRAKLVLLSFEESLKYINGTVVGNPVRKRILSIQRVVEDASSSTKRILIIGGSQGALSLNKEIISSLEELKDYQITHIIGKRDYARILNGLDLSKYPNYHAFEYLHSIEDAYKNADIVVSRAGATAIAEILSIGLPSILIPFPYAADGHQDINAEVASKAGAAFILKDKDIKQLPALIKSISLSMLNEMKIAASKLVKKDPANKIADLLNEII